MKFLRGTFIGLFCLVVGFLVVWQPWPTQAQGSAPAQGKPTVYDFGRSMCIPCKEMEKILAELNISSRRVDMANSARDWSLSARISAIDRDRVAASSRRMVGRTARLWTRGTNSNPSSAAAELQYAKKHGPFDHDTALWRHLEPHIRLDASR